jgi:hypothetical protein
MVESDEPNDNVQEISVLSTQRKQNLASWGLPDTILKVYTDDYVRNWFYKKFCISYSRITFLMVGRYSE